MMFNLQAQDPLWSSGGQTVSFTSNSLTPSNYPIPTPIPGYTSSALYYSPPSNFLASQAQYDKSGNLLFFIVNGAIYNKRGYLIASNFQNSNSGSIGSPIGEKPSSFTIMPEIIISPVPNLDPEENCYLFYVIMSYSESSGIFSACHSTAVIVDISAENHHFSGSDPEIRGELISSSEFSNYPGLFSSFVGSQEMEIYNSAPNGSGDGYHRLELMDSHTLSTNQLIINYHNGYDIIELDAQAAFTETQGSTYSASPNATTKNQIVGECEVAYNPTLSTHVMATLKPNDNQHPSIYVSHVNANGSLVQETVIANFTNPILGLPTQGPVSVFGMEFSDNGRYLYINVGYGSNYQSGRLFCYDVENLTWVTLTMSWGQYASRDMHLSQIEGQLYNGLSAIYIPSSTGLAVFNNANNPTSGSFTFNAYGVPPLSYSIYSNYDGTTADIRYMSKQNHDGTAIQSFLATSACCQEGVIACGYGDQTFSDIETWLKGDNPFEDSHEPILVYGILDFENGSDYKLDSMVFEFGEDAELIIRTGGRVDLDTTTFTSTCGDMWPGVTIEGTQSATQSPPYGGSQGYMRMLDSSRVEHANTGVHINGGGILIAQNSIFRDNRTGVYMQPYSIGFSNLTRFVDCTFITDQLLLDGIPYPRVHLDLNKVEGILIDKTSFLNTSSFSAMSINRRGSGIVAFNSSFTVKGENEPYTGPSDDAHDSFYKLTTGINTSNTGIRTCVIKNMEFQRNRSGIWITETENPTVIFNHFIIPPNVYVNGETNRVPEGAYLLESSGYTVEENNFSLQAFAANGRTTGLIIEDSNDYPTSDPLHNAENEVFRNSFTRLEVGLRIRGDNRGAQPDYGLQSRCEYYTACDNDVLLESASEWRDVQGFDSPSVTKLTNNKFSYASPNCTSSHDHRVSNTYGPAPDHNLTFTYHALELNSDFTWPDCLDDTNSPVITRITRSTPVPLEFDEFDYDRHCISNYNLVKSKDESNLAKNNDELILEYLALQELHESMLAEYLLTASLDTPDETIRTTANNLSGELYRLERAINDAFIHSQSLENGELAEQDMESYLSFLELSTNSRHDMQRVRIAVRNDDIPNAIAILSEIEGLDPEEAAWWSHRLELEEMDELSEETEGELWYRYENAMDGTANEALAYLHGHGYSHVMPTWDEEEEGFKRLQGAAVNSSLIRLSPNPATDLLVIEYLGDKEESLYLEIRDVLGRKLDRIDYANSINNQIDLTTYPAGLYHVTLNSDEEVIDQAKFIKQ